MSFQLKIKLEGLEEAFRNLAEFPRNLQGPMLRAAVRAASTPMLQRARMLCPVGDTGLLRKSLGRRFKTYRKNGVVAVYMGPRRGFKTIINGRAVNPTNYAHLVEYGTSQHFLGKKGSKETGLLHPGARARPFLRPAFDQTKGIAVEMFVQKINEDMIAACKKMVKQRKVA